MWCVVDNHNCMSNVCAKRFLDSNLNKRVVDKISISHTRVVILKVIIIGKREINCFYL